MTVLQRGDERHRLPPWPLSAPSAGGGRPDRRVHQVLRGSRRLDGLRLLRGPRGKLIAGVIALVVGGTGLVGCSSGTGGPGGGTGGPTASSTAGASGATGTPGVPGTPGTSPAPGSGTHRVDTGLRLLTPLPRPEPDLRTILRTDTDIAVLAARLRTDGDPAAARRLRISLAGPPPSGEAFLVSVLALHCRFPDSAQLWRSGDRLTVRPIGGSGMQCLGATPAAGGGELPGGYALVVFSTPIARVPENALLDGLPLQPVSTGRITSSPVH